MAPTDHLVDAPEWVIERSGAGSFMVQCSCGWYRQGFDTASSARAAGHNHTVTSKAPPTPIPGVEPAATATQKRRWFRRS